MNASLTKEDLRSLKTNCFVVAAAIKDALARHAPLELEALDGAVRHLERLIIWIYRTGDSELAYLNRQVLALRSSLLDLVEHVDPVRSRQLNEVAQEVADTLRSYTRGDSVPDKAAAEAVTFLESLGQFAGLALNKRT